jgi:hypothetical protein
MAAWVLEWGGPATIAQESYRDYGECQGLRVSSAAHGLLRDALGQLGRYRCGIRSSGKLMQNSPYAQVWLASDWVHGDSAIARGYR